MKVGDKVTMGGVEYTVTASTEDSTPEQALAGRRWARTYMEWAGIPPITDALLSVEPFSQAELAAMEDGSPPVANPIEEEE